MRFAPLLCASLAACTLPDARLREEPGAEPAACLEQMPEATTGRRPRDLGVVIGDLPPGAQNAITDVAGVQVGHATLHQGERVRTGVTVVLPHAGNLHAEKVPAAIIVGNGYGKLVGSTQVRELGELESPIGLTNTLCVARVMDALVGHMLALPGNEELRSVNVVVGETNDGRLNDIRGRHVRKEHVRQALAAAAAGPVAEGSVGAGTGTVCFGWKGGIGTASRRAAGYTVGVLVQTNFGGSLTIRGVPVYRSLQPTRAKRRGDGSCVIVVATDAPLLSRNLRRLARRALHGMARTGASFSNGSGDYVIAFSTAEELRIRKGAPKSGAPTLANDRVTRLFVGVAEATEEAIVNSLFAATTVESAGGRALALPHERVLPLLRR